MADKKTTAADIHKLIKEKEVKYVDIRFTDPRGKWQHVTFDLMMVDDDFLNEGTMFDGSSIAGWKAINESDMLLKPDLDTAVIDPFFAQTTLILICDVLEPTTGQNYARCPRSIAKAAEAFVNSSGVGDTTYFGPEAEFFIFDDVRFDVGMNKGFYYVDSKEGAYNTGTEYPEGNLGHRPKVKGGYFPVPPVDSEQDMRGEMLAVMRDMGIQPEKHHHEVATAQHELGFKFNTLTKCGDYMQIYKYVIHQVAQAYGKTATFMPKPVYGDNGSGMHVHQSIWKGGKPLFAGSGYADLSDTLPVLHRRHHQACQGAQRLHQPADQQLQAPDPRLRGAGAAGLFGRATARPPAAFPSRPRPTASASRCASPIRARTPISPMPPC